MGSLRRPGPASDGTACHPSATSFGFQRQPRRRHGEPILENGRVGRGPGGLRVHVRSQLDGQAYETFFRDFPIRIGRNRLNDLVLDHPYVSQWHAVIGCQGDRLTMTQVGSTNAVVVGERKLGANEEVLLRSDENVRIVPFEIRLQRVVDPRGFRHWSSQARTASLRQLPMPR